MDEVLLDNIALDIDVPHLIEHLRVAPESEDAARIRTFAAEALAVGKPKGLYRVAFIDERGLQ